MSPMLYIIITLVAIDLIVLLNETHRQYLIEDVRSLIEDETYNIKRNKDLKKVVVSLLMMIRVVLFILILIIIIPFRFLIYIIQRLFSKQNGKEHTNPKKSNRKGHEPYYEMNSFDIPITAPEIIFFSYNLPFKPEKSQIIYVEDEYSDLVNEHVKSHFEKLNSFVNKRGLSLAYLPKVNENIDSIAGYYLPHIIANTTLPNSSIVFKYSELFFYLKDRTSLNPGFIRYVGEESGFYKFSYFKLEISDNSPDVGKQIHNYILAIRLKHSLYSLGKPNPDDIADSGFPYEAQKLIDEIKERVDKLRTIGFQEMVIKALFKEEQKLSRLVITKEYRILLPDYNNLEIHLSPLPKAIFILFINHPEGILFKNLIDYKQELTEIYLKVSNREKLDDVMKSLDDVTDPTKNSINEKCSRIREAFIKEFDESLSSHYFITGGRAEPKRIALDRSLVLFET